MESSRYTAETINLEDVNNPHSLAILDVPPGSRVLDIGAADGSVAARLTERGCRVFAVEIEADAANAARAVCEQVVEGDVETLDLAATFGGTEFDTVLMLDVLEHLRDPEAVLRKAARCLAPRGRVIVSVPNVTHAALRLQLLTGTFRYTETGLLDRTHLRFFDRPALEEMVQRAGLSVLQRMRTTRGLTETEIEIDPGAFPPETLALATADADADTYQFVYVLVLEPVPADQRSEASLPEVLQRRVVEAERLRAEAETYVESLEARVAELEHLENIAVELEERLAELREMHEQLTHARMDIAVKEAQLVELRSEIAPLRAEVDRLQTVLGYARHRLVDRLSAASKRMPIAHTGLKRAVERAGYRRR